MKPYSKQIITIVVMVTFLAIVLFSFTFMMQGPDERMTGDCPFSAMGQSLCPQDIIAGAIHHISAYHAFINVPVGASMAVLIVFLLFAICVSFIIFISSLSLEPPTFSRVLSNFPIANSYRRKLTQWLSRFENSPSF